MLVGPNTWAPLAAICKSQTAVSHSSTEAETIALDHVLRTEGIPLHSLLQHIVGSVQFVRDAAVEKSPQLYMYVLEDNEAAIKIVLKKRSMALRHVFRTHRVALDWLYDLPHCQFLCHETYRMEAQPAMLILKRRSMVHLG